MNELGRRSIAFYFLKTRQFTCTGLNSPSMVGDQFGDSRMNVWGALNRHAVARWRTPRRGMAAAAKCLVDVSKDVVTTSALLRAS